MQYTQQRVLYQTHIQYSVSITRVYHIEVRRRHQYLVRNQDYCIILSGISILPSFIIIIFISIEYTLEKSFMFFK